METEDNSASRSGVEKPPNTPDMSVHDAEAMADSIYEILHCQIPKGAVRRSWKMAEATSFRRREKTRSFLREMAKSSLRRLLQVSLYHLVGKDSFLCS